MSKRYVRLLVLILSYLSLVQAAAYDREGIAGRRLAKTGNKHKGQKGRKGQAKGQLQGSVLIVTETVRETVTAGSGAGVNGTIAAGTVTETVTVTQKEAAGALPGTGNLQLSFVTTTVFGTGSPSTVTITALPQIITQTIAQTITQIQSVPAACSSSQVPGVVAGAPAATDPANDGLPRASGGVGVTTVSIPAALRTSTLEVPPAATAPSTSISVSSVEATSTTSAELVASSTSSALELSTTSTAEAIITTSSTNAITTSTSSTAPAVAITSVVSVESPSSTSTSTRSSSSSSTAVAVGGGTEPTSVLVLPAVSAANPTTTAVAPGVANGGIQLPPDVSGLSLTNVLNLGNLVPPTAAARP
ncbi:hypothetical protein B0H65DRAFT_36956 [Neurospora tetraspora]|uniref:Uncharacterized protein n=1 Tax=Neurospora tetraspora TaxID=94610 RepID=A0AAE0JNY9_9PEZI|nr:hypothetical protein B0H65DRAFT_36956 [Neurospora tetraspora]